MAKEPITGTWDFFQDAKTTLDASDMPFLLIGAQDGGRISWNASNIQSKGAVRWFRERASHWLEKLENDLPE